MLALQTIVVLRFHQLNSAESIPFFDYSLNCFHIQKESEIPPVPHGRLLENGERILSAMGYFALLLRIFI